ncbi:MAG TPA: hypothetical protein VIT89_04165 [Solirubrobacterales bacterium]
MRLLVIGLVALAGLTATVAQAERSQKGNLIVSLDGGLSPLALPRDRPAPVAVHLEGGLQTSDGQPLPRVTRIELGLPSQGVVSTQGLPRCAPRLLRNAKPPEALAACRDALVGRGRLQASVSLPNQDAFSVGARVIAFNGRIDGGRAVLLHAFTANPPTVAVLPLRLRRQGGRFGLALVGELSPALGPWPRLRSFDVTFFRRYSDRGRLRSYLSASCPIPKSFTAGFFSFAKVSFGLADGRRISTGIARGCRAR